LDRYHVTLSFVTVDCIPLGNESCSGHHADSFPPSLLATVTPLHESIKDFRASTNSISCLSVSAC